MRDQKRVFFSMHMSTAEHYRMCIIRQKSYNTAERTPPTRTATDQGEPVSSSDMRYCSSHRGVVRAAVKQWLLAKKKKPQFDPYVIYVGPHAESISIADFVDGDRSCIMVGAAWPTQDELSQYLTR
jgi:hypothetical protein